LAIALPIGILCGLAKPLLALWLGPDYSDLSWLVVALVGHLCVNLAVVPLFPIQEATNKVRVPGILTLVMGVANTGLAVALAKWSGWGYISIAIAGAIMLTAKNTLFTPLYAARIIELPWYTFIPSLLTGILGFVTVGAVSFLGAASSPSMSWGQLALIVASISGGYLIAAYFLGLNSGDRKLLETEIRRRFMG
jgi:hypothetical protein